MIEQACQLYPQIQEHIDFIDVGTPITNMHYIRSPHGEIYGLPHSKHRMSPEVSAKSIAKIAPGFLFSPIIMYSFCSNIIIDKKD